MLFPKIFYYNAKSLPLNHYFFMLSKGENAGKAAMSPWANSFCIRCSNEEEKFRLYWLCKSLFIAGRYKCHLKGTAVQCLIKNDVKQVLRYGISIIGNDATKLKKIINSLQSIELVTASLQNQIAKTNSLEQAILKSFFASAR